MENIPGSFFSEDMLYQDSTEDNLVDYTDIIHPFLIKNKIEAKDATPYCERVLRDYQELREFLPPDKQYILEIGAAWGGHALYLGKYYQNASFALIDGTRTIPKTKTGFREEAEPYRNGNIAVRLLKQESIYSRLYPVKKETYNITLPGIDFVVSFCAYCHHFPAYVYLPLIQRSLSSGGHLLVDIRRNTNGREQLEMAGFEVEQIIREKDKYTRTLFRKK